LKLATKSTKFMQNKEIVQDNPPDLTSLEVSNSLTSNNPNSGQRD